MPTYSAYGLTLRSDLALPGLDEAAERPDADVSIELRELTPDRLGAREVGPDWIYGTYQDKANVLVADGERIVLDIRTPIEDGNLTGLVLGELMSTLLRQRGLLVLHACAVAADNGAICFLGESGWGKSTLAEFFCQQGYRLITDDVTAVAVRDGKAFAIPSYPQIRLRDDAAAQLVPQGGLERIDRNGPKRASVSHRMETGEAPLRALLLLEPGFRDRTEIVDVPPREALMRLIAHTRAKTLINTNAPDLLSGHLQQCLRIAEAVPVQMLRRRRSLEGLSEIQDLVEETFGLQAPSTQTVA